MNRLARILLVEPEDALRRHLDWHLQHAGHEVAAVADPEAARSLVDEGLQPDIVLAHSNRPGDRSLLKQLLPHATHLRIAESEDEGGAPQAAPSASSSQILCPPDPGVILRRLEEILFHYEPTGAPDEASRCMDLARRLANSLPNTRTAEARVDLVTEGFDAFFGVRGTLVVRRGIGDEWIEVRQGLSSPLADRISAEIARRTQHRGLRPFLAGIDDDGTLRQVACLAIQVGDLETDLAMALDRAPTLPAHRESLMNLVGAAIRFAMNEEAAEETRDLLEAQVASFESLLALSREFTDIGNRRVLCTAVLRALHRELRMSRSALFLSRGTGGGILDLQATHGFPEAILARIGLSAVHGVGEECMGLSGPKRLATLAADGAARRELRLLGDASLRWAVPFRAGGHVIGALFFGSPDEGDDFTPSDRQLLVALLEAASVSLQGLVRVEILQDQAVRALKGLVAAIEMVCPEERGHAERVTRLAVRVGRAIGLAPDDLRDLAFAAMVHDVGMIVRKPPETEGAEGARSERTHPVVGSRILSRAKPASNVIQAVEQHHERWDGLGFPYGIREADIHLLARIIGIADAYDDAMFGPDSASTPDEAMHRLERGAGLLWDPGLLAVFAGEVTRRVVNDPDAEGDGWLEQVLGTL
ncbi:HD domain-containing protein [bacterium]|nr:HD domain-containing protein [bacterium]